MLRKFVQVLFYFAVFLTPLIISAQTSEMFEIPKMFFLYAIGFAIFCLFWVDVFLSKKKISFNYIHLLALIFLISQIISLVFSIDPHTSWYGYYGRLNGGVLSTIVFCIYLFVGTNIFDRKSFRNLMIVSILASSLVFLWGAPGRLIGVDTACVYFRQDFSTSCWTNEFRPAERMFSTLGQPNWLGTYFVAHLFIGLFVMFSKNGQEQLDISLKKLNENIFGNIPLLAYILVMALGVYFTGSRSAFLALVVPFVMELFVYMKQNCSRVIFRSAIIFAFIAILLGSSLYAYSFLSSQTTGNITHSGKIRLIVWEGAIKLAQRYPLFGTGPETFAYSYFLTRPEAHNQTSERDFIYNKAHNELLNMLANTGAVGLLTYCTLLGFAVFQLFRFGFSGRILSYVIIAISICNLFGFSTSTTQLILYFALSSGVIVYRDRVASFDLDLGMMLKTKILGPIITTSFIGIIVGVWVYSSIFVWKYVSADLAYANAISHYESSDPVRAISSCVNALEYKFEHLYADKCASIFGSTAALLADTKSEELIGYREDLVSQADRLSQVAIQASPRNPIYIKSRIRLLHILSKVDNVNSKKYGAEIPKLITLHSVLAPTDHSLGK